MVGWDVCYYPQIREPTKYHTSWVAVPSIYLYRTAKHHWVPANYEKVNNIGRKVYLLGFFSEKNSECIVKENDWLLDKGWYPRGIPASNNRWDSS